MGNITLKLMVRAKDAPEETAKYNGHGVCDNKAKSTQLNSATDNSEVVFKEVQSLVKSCTDLIPNDLRGVGITISKLEKTNGKKNQSTSNILKFVKTKSNLKTPTVQSIGAETNGSKCPTKTFQNVDGGSFAHAAAGNQVNAEVLNELPPEIRAEVEAEYNIATSTSKPALNGRSNAVNQLEGDNSNSCDISFSQLDQDVLSELPTELQVEINRHFSVREDQKKEAENQTRTKTAFDALMTLTSPTKNIKPGRGRKKGSVNKSRKLNSPKKLLLKTVTSRNFDNEDHSSVDIDVFNSLPDDIKTEVQAQMFGGRLDSRSKESVVSESTETEATDKENGDEVPLCKNKGLQSTKVRKTGVEYLPSFMGRTGIVELRPLLKEWISSTECPVSDDINLLDDFFFDLIKCKEIDLVRILIKCLHRNILKRDDAELWKETWKSLVIKTQSVMKETYRKPLLITEKF